MIGLTIVNITKPGAGLDVSAMPKGDVSAYAAQGQGMKFTDFVTHIVPSSPVDAFAQGDILQIVFFAVLFGFAVVTLEGIALLLGVDRFMSEARAITNLIGNGVATLVISRSEHEFDDTMCASAISELAEARMAVHG